jgi:hypothetical protein
VFKIFSCSEKTASNVTVTFPQKSGKDAVIGVEKIIVPDGVEQNSVPKYDETMEIPSTAFVGGNIAILKLQKPLVIDDSKLKLDIKRRKNT